jgi:hypothetical protein
MAWLMPLMLIAIKKDCATSAIKQILIIGIFTLLATRLFGNLGMAALGAGCMVGNFSQIPACAAIFFGARILEQVFAYANVSNVTGINLNHPYVSAALYLGLFSALGLMALLKDVSDRRIAAAAFALQFQPLAPALSAISCIVKPLVAISLV